jgi:hypothetical protein
MYKNYLEFLFLFIYLLFILAVVRFELRASHSDIHAA